MEVVGFGDQSRKESHDDWNHFGYIEPVLRLFRHVELHCDYFRGSRINNVTEFVSDCRGCNSTDWFIRTDDPRGSSWTKGNALICALPQVIAQFHH